jgi:hypothetical protein
MGQLWLQSWHRDPSLKARKQLSPGLSQIYEIGLINVVTGKWSMRGIVCLVDDLASCVIFEVSDLGMCKNAAQELPMERVSPVVGRTIRTRGPWCLAREFLTTSINK